MLALSREKHWEKQKDSKKCHVHYYSKKVKDQIFITVMAVPPFTRSALKDADIFTASACPHAYAPFNNVFHCFPGDH